jgi:hypothetical protein
MPARGYLTLHRTVLDYQQTSFKVRAPSDAKLALLGVPSNFRALSYEIIIGAEQNTLTVIRVRSPGGEVESQVNSPNILSASELRPFWIQWINGTIELGAGDAVGVNSILKLVDPDPAYRKHIHSIAVASLAGETAEWEFGSPFDTGKINLFDDDDDENFIVGISFFDLINLLFRACRRLADFFGLSLRCYVE